MPINPHQHVKVASWNLPKNAYGHPLVSQIIKRNTEVNLLTDVVLPSGTHSNTPIENNGRAIAIYGEVNANHPLYIFTNGIIDEKKYLLQEVYPVAIDGEYHFYLNLENTPKYLWIGTGQQGLTITLKYTVIE